MESERWAPQLADSTRKNQVCSDCHDFHAHSSASSPTSRLKLVVAVQQDFFKSCIERMISRRRSLVVWICEATDLYISSSRRRQFQSEVNTYLVVAPYQGASSKVRQQSDRQGKRYQTKRGRQKRERIASASISSDPR